MAKKIWFPHLHVHGFEERNGAYRQVLSSGVVRQFVLSKDPHGAETFMVMCGVDSVPRVEGTDLDYGFAKNDGLYHLTPRGWDYNSGRWPCETEEQAFASITALLPLILELAVPWLESITTLSHVGDEINEVKSPGLGWIKARLYMLDGNIPRAREVAEKYADYVEKPEHRRILLPEDIEEDKERAARILAEVEEAARRAG